MNTAGVMSRLAYQCRKPIGGPRTACLGSYWSTADGWRPSSHDSTIHRRHMDQTLCCREDFWAKAFGLPIRFHELPHARWRSNGLWLPEIASYLKFIYSYLLGIVGSLSGELHISKVATTRALCSQRWEPGFESWSRLVPVVSISFSL